MHVCRSKIWGCRQNVGRTWESFQQVKTILWQQVSHKRHAWYVHFCLSYVFLVLPPWMHRMHNPWSCVSGCDQSYHSAHSVCLPMILSLWLDVPYLAPYIHLCGILLQNITTGLIQSCHFTCLAIMLCSRPKYPQMFLCVLVQHTMHTYLCHCTFNRQKIHLLLFRHISFTSQSISTCFQCWYPPGKMQPPGLLTSG